MRASRSAHARGAPLRALETLDAGRDDNGVYEALHEHYTSAEITELSAVLLPDGGRERTAESWGIEPEVGGVIPDGVMSMHALAG